MKKTIALMAAAVVMMILSLPGFTFASEKITLKFHLEDPPSTTYYLGLMKFKEEVEQKTNGDIIVEVYASGQLGSVKDALEGLQYGTIQCSAAATPAMATFVPEYDCLDFPFLFNDSARAHAVLDGEVGQWLSGLMLERTGIRVMGYMDTGFRNLYARKPIASLADFKGLKVRTMPSDIHMATFSALGAIPTPMDGREVFTALQQGTIDAAENAYSYIVAQKMNEAAGYVIASGHFFGNVAILISEKTYQSLTAEQRTIIDTAAVNCVAYQREAMEAANNKDKETLASLGMKVIEIDRAELRAAVQSVYDKYKGKVDPEIFAKITE